MLQACYGNRSDGCYAEAFPSSAEFVAVQQALSFHCENGCKMLNHDQQTAAVRFHTLQRLTVLSNRAGHNGDSLAAA